MTRTHAASRASTAERAIRMPSSRDGTAVCTCTYSPTTSRPPSVADSSGPMLTASGASGQPSGAGRAGLYSAFREDGWVLRPSASWEPNSGANRDRAMQTRVDRPGLRAEVRPDGVDERGSAQTAGPEYLALASVLLAED